MKIMSDAEAFGWKFLSFLMIVLVIAILLSNSSPDTNEIPLVEYDTITVNDTVVIHDTVYKWKEPKKQMCDTTIVSYDYTN